MGLFVTRRPGESVSVRDLAGKVQTRVKLHHGGHEPLLEIQAPRHLRIFRDDRPIDPEFDRFTTEFDRRSLPERAYTAYGASAGWQNFRGEPMPEWQSLPEQTRKHWEAAVGEVVAALGESREQGTGNRE